jgi:16S rRNA (cytidine1402-2'-O)-methyltransferase
VTKEKLKSKTLYIVATPIGNLNEVSKRTFDVLSEVDLIACEDTRVTNKLLKHLGIKKSLLVCHEHNEHATSERIIELLLDNYKIALVSDAGYPLISDPGNKLVSSVLENGIEIVVINGPSAILPALIGSGLVTNHFYFHGFLSSKQSDRLSELRKLYQKEEVLIFYEAPHRLHKTVQDLYEIFGDRKMTIARELTKMHEEYIRTSLEDCLNMEPGKYKGELVLVVDGYAPENVKVLNDKEILHYLNQNIKQGFSFKDAIKNVATIHNLPKNMVYRIYIKHKDLIN